MDWSAYPEHHGNTKMGDQVFDRHFYRERLLEDADRLFSAQSRGLDIVFLCREPQYVNLKCSRDSTHN